MKKINVVAAIIVNMNQVLCVQRRHNKYEYISEKYEFPGGKVEDDETEKEALIREIQEELSLTIEVGEKFIIVDHDYPDFSISMHTYHCVSETRDIILNEHIDYKWLAISDMKVLDWAAADIPIVNKLRGQ